MISAPVDYLPVPDREPVYGVLGVLGALALSVGLIPFRGSTPAANLAFVFLILTIVVAEMGGRTAALATAVVSALGLNFFLIEPYLTLQISKRDDIVAFAALMVSGLIAASFRRRRVRATRRASRTSLDLDALHGAAGGLLGRRPLDEALEDLRLTFGLGGLVLRHGDGRLVCAAPPVFAERSAPTILLEPDTLMAADDREHRLGPLGFRLPAGGGRIRLGATGATPSLDVWEGSEEGLGTDERRALAVAVAMLELALRPPSSP